MPGLKWIHAPGVEAGIYHAIDHAGYVYIIVFNDKAW